MSDEERTKIEHYKVEMAEKFARQERLANLAKDRIAELKNMDNIWQNLKGYKTVLSAEIHIPPTHPILKIKGFSCRQNHSIMLGDVLCVFVPTADISMTDYMNCHYIMGKYILGDVVEYIWRHNLTRYFVEGKTYQIVTENDKPLGPVVLTEQQMEELRFDPAEETGRDTGEHDNEGDQQTTNETETARKLLQTRTKRLGRTIS